MLHELRAAIVFKTSAATSGIGALRPEAKWISFGREPNGLSASKLKPAVNGEETLAAPLNRWLPKGLCRQALVVYTAWTIERWIVTSIAAKEIPQRANWWKYSRLSPGRVRPTTRRDFKTE